MWTCITIIVICFLGAVTDCIRDYTRNKKGKNQ